MERYDKSTMPVNAEKIFMTHRRIRTLVDTYISAIPTIFFGVVSIAQLVEATDSAVLGGVVEVVNSNPAMSPKYFQHLPA